MKTKTHIKTIFTCSLERAFKSPMLCDVTKVHTGFGPMPKVTHCTEDENWGKVGGSRKVFMEKTLSFKGGESGLDTVLERVENEHWKIEVGDLKYGATGIRKFVGTWDTKEIAPGKIEVVYAYTVHTWGVLLYPFHWLFTKLLWRTYMKQVVANIKKLAYSDAPYLHD